MFIYFVQGTVHGYDTYDSFVCVAESAEDARRMFPGGAYVQWSDSHERWEMIDDACGGFLRQYDLDEWDSHIRTIGVKLLGRAEPGASVGVVCASYHAG